jgi:hypothetical protein
MTLLCEVLGALLGLVLGEVLGRLLGEVLVVFSLSTIEIVGFGLLGLVLSLVPSTLPRIIAERINTIAAQSNALRRGLEPSSSVEVAA